MSTEAGAQPTTKALDLPELESRLDAQHPWPGLEGYEEGDQDFFKGRSDEIEELYRLIRRERLTLLYGKTGTGKSSLVRAGLFPKQRREEALPVWIRLDYSEDAPALSSQVKTAIHEAARTANLEATPPSDDLSLWEYLHLHKGEFWSRHHRIIMPFLVFDQFEELFTHGLVHREFEVRKFISELSDLAEDRVPAALFEDTTRLNRCNLDRHHYKLVVCLQEEHLAELDRMRDDLPPALFHNRMRLTEMTLEQAKEVVEQTGKEVGADALAGEIAERASEDTKEHGRETEMGVTKPCVSPALLAVLCTTLNQKRLDEGASKISRGHLEAVGPSILAGFYERQLESLPEIPGQGSPRLGRTRSQEVNDRIAEEFVDGEVRVGIPESRARTVFGDAALAKLLSDKVLGRTPHGRIELLHGVLPETVERSRGRFLKEWADRLVRVFIPGVAAGALVAGLLGGGALGFSLGRAVPSGGGGTEVGPGPGPGGGGEDGAAGGTGGIEAGVGPTTADGAFFFGSGIVKALNEGTASLRAAVGQLRVGAFDDAEATLEELGGDLVGREDEYCRGADYSFPRVAEVVGYGCDAFERQAILARTLAGLAATAPESLADPATRDSVVASWTEGEAAFRGYRDQINEIVVTWLAQRRTGP